MPLYEYRCRDCGARVEVLQRMGEGPEGLDCSECGASRLEKQFSTFASSTAPSGGPSRGQGSAPGCGAGGFT